MIAHARGALFPALLSAAGVFAAACDDATTATSPTITSPVTETFSGQFLPGGSAARSFTAASPTTQLTVHVDAGAYGVRLHDLGTLTSQIAFTVTIVRP